MMRTRAWRRYKEEEIVVKRLKRLRGRWYYYIDKNNRRVQNPIWSDFIGTSHHFMFKTYTTCKNDSKFKVKYSPNKTKGYWRGDVNRSRDKVQFRKMLDREYGLKHFNTK